MNYKGFLRSSYFLFGLLELFKDFKKRFIKDLIKQEEAKAC